MVIKAIVFDCFGVLAMPGHIMILVDYPQHAEGIMDIFKQSDFGILESEELHSRLGELVGVSAQEIKSHYWNTTVLNRLVIDWIKELKGSEGYKTALVSNVSQSLISEIFPKDLREELFDAEVLSFDVGVRKPSLEIYEMVARKLDVDINECVMIDDNLDNVDGAVLAGMKGILYTSIDQVRADMYRILKGQDA